MKPVRFNKLVLALLFIFAVGGLFAQEKEKSLEHKFKDVDGAFLVLNNRYGDIDIQNWDKNEVEIKIQIKLDAGNPDKTEELIQYLNVEFETEGKQLKATTVIDEKFSKSRRGWFDFDRDKKFSINYFIKMPANLDLSVKNRYGDLFANELTGLVNVNIRYGTMRANRIYRGDKNPLSTITLSYTSRPAYIEECSWLKLDMRYSKIEVEKAKALLVVSKYSTIEVDEASSLVTDSRYDHYYLGELNNLSIDTRYSNVKVKKVAKKFEFVGGYTDCKVMYVPADFKLVDVQTKYGNVRVGIDEAASYQISAKARYGKVYYPHGGRVNKYVESNEMEVDGNVGSEDSKSIVKISARYATVKLNY